MWLGATALAVAYALGTQWGPTLFGVSRIAAHGVHLVDVIALAAVWSWAWWGFPLFGRRRGRRTALRER